MTCPCLYPVILNVTDSDGDKVKYWSMPEDELDREFEIPKIQEVIHKNEKYMAVLWHDPGDADLKPYEINEHIVYAGCNFDDKIRKGGKLVCKEKELFLVLHPINEWYSYHIKNYNI